MRRSKSNPAKYARNYRSISQRQRTAFDHLDEEKEMERLKANALASKAKQDEAESMLESARADLAAKPLLPLM